MILKTVYNKTLNFMQKIYQEMQYCMIQKSTDID